MQMIHGLFDEVHTRLVGRRRRAGRVRSATTTTVRAAVPPERLVEWQPGDGWEPICDALGVPVPDVPFPHANTTDDFRAMVGLD